MSIPLNVLLVEDSAADAELLLAALARDGFLVHSERVQNAADLQGALGRGSWDVILCDYVMPAFAAPDAIRVVRARDPDMPLIIVSGTVGEEIAVEAIKLGATDYLLKDRLAGLGLAVRRALQQRRHRIEHAAATKALLRSEEILAQARHIARLGSWDLELTNLQNVDVNPLRWSDEMFRIFGFEPGGIAVTNESFFRCVHPADRERIRLAVAETLRTGSPYSLDHRVIWPDGTERVIHEQATVLRDATGRPLSLVGTAQDVTDRWATAEALRESEERLRMVTDNAQVGLVMLDGAGRYTFANETFREMMGITSTELIGKTFAVTLDAAYAHQVKSGLARAFQGERIAYELTRQAEGGTRHYAVRNEPLKLRGGETLVVVVITEVTERKAAEELLRASEARYHTLFEYAPDGIVIADRASRYLDANASACRMLGYTREELIGLQASDIVMPAETPHITAALNQLTHQADHHREWQFRRKDGSSFAAEVIATTMPDGSLLGMIRDITERRQTEEAIQSQLSELRRWHAMTLGREEHILGLKREINELLARQGLPPRYLSPDLPL